MKLECLIIKRFTSRCKNVSLFFLQKRYFSKFKLGTVAFEEFFDGSPPTFGISQMKKKPSKMSNPVIDLTEDLMQSQTKHGSIMKSFFSL